MLERIRNWLTEKYIHSLLFLLSALVVGCQEKEEVIAGTQEIEDVEVVFTLRASSSPSTYAAITVEEYEIREIDVLVFKEEGSDEMYAYTSRGKITAGTDGKEFSVILEKDPVNTYRFVILVNARSFIQDDYLLKGTLKEALLAKIESAVNGRWESETLPMWGESSVCYPIDEGMSIPSIQLLRSLAKVDLISKLNTDDFELKEVEVRNWKTRGRIVPDTGDDYWDPTLTLVKKASEPASKTGLTGILPLTYDQVEEKAIRNQIYLHEAAAVEEYEDLEATCLIIGGYYKKQTELSYYRADFRQKTGDQYTYMDILRNHHYSLNITGVYDEGYVTPDSAFLYKQANITVEITTWNIGDMADIPIGGNYTFSFSQSRFDLTPDVPSAVLKVDTDYPGAWMIEDLQGAFTVETKGNEIHIQVDTGIGQSFNGSFGFKAAHFIKTIYVNYTI